MHSNVTMSHMDAQGTAPTADERRQLLSIEELADYLDVPVATVRRWRIDKTGPRGIRVGRHIRYRPSDVEFWLELRADPKPVKRR